MGETKPILALFPTQREVNEALASMRLPGSVWQSPQAWLVGKSYEGLSWIKLSCFASKKLRAWLMLNRVVRDCGGLNSAGSLVSRVVLRHMGCPS